MPNEPIWLPADAVIEHNRLELAETGEHHFLRANGCDTIFDDTVAWADEMVKILEHQSTEEDFVGLIRPYIASRN